MNHKSLLFLLALLSCKTPQPKQPTEEHIYLLGWEIDTFKRDEACRNTIRNMAITKNMAYLSSESMELVFRNGHLAEVYNKSRQVRNKKTLTKEEQKFKYFKVDPSEMFGLVAALGTESYLGGEPPVGFEVPKFEFVAPFQYLGKLSKSEPAFAWLPFDVHLVAPIYLNIDKLYIDYADPNRPRVLDVEALKRAGTSYDNLKSDSEIVFEKVSMKALKSTIGVSRKIGHTGVPNWIQNPDIPVCPKSKRPMRFLCQISSEAGVMTARTNVVTKNEYAKTYFDHLNFWGAGDLYIFFEPESKIACFLIQNT